MDAHGETRPRSRRHSNRKNKESRNVEFLEPEIPRDKIIEEEDIGDESWNNYHVEEDSGASLTYKILFFVLLLILGGLATLVLIDNNYSSLTQVDPTEDQIQAEVEESYIASSWLDWLTHEEVDDHGLVEEHDEEAHEFIDEHDEDHDEQNEVPAEEQEFDQSELPPELTPNQSPSEAAARDQDDSIDVEREHLEDETMEDETTEERLEDEPASTVALSEGQRVIELEDEKAFLVEAEVEELEGNEFEGFEEEAFRSIVDEAGVDSSKDPATIDELDETVNPEFNLVKEDSAQPDFDQHHVNEDENEIITDLDNELI